MRTTITYIVMAALLATTWLAPVPALAERGDNRWQQRSEQREAHRPGAVAREQRNHYRADERHYARERHEARQRIHVAPPRTAVQRWHAVPRDRRFHGIPVYRHYGHRYPGYGFYYRDADAFPWIAFTVLTMAIVNQLDEHQQRLHEQAFVRATTANAGDTIYWQDEHSNGSISVQSIWYDRYGRQCRDLQQTVHTRGRSEIGDSTVCLRPDGSWEVVGSQRTVIR